MDVSSEGTMGGHGGGGTEKRARSGSGDRSMVSIKAYLGIDDASESRENGNTAAVLCLCQASQPQAGGIHKAGGIERVPRTPVGERQPLNVALPYVPVSSVRSGGKKQHVARAGSAYNLPEYHVGDSDSTSKEAVVYRGDEVRGRPSSTSEQQQQQQNVRRAHWVLKGGRATLYGTLSLTMIIVIHSCCINSFHLVNQFGPPILLEKQTQMTPYTAALLASLTTVAPTIGPLSLDSTWTGTSAQQSFLSSPSRVSSQAFHVYCLLYLDDLPMEPVLLAISISEVVMPTTIMVLIPEYVFGEGGH